MKRRLIVSAALTLLLAPAASASLVTLRAEVSAVDDIEVVGFIDCTLPDGSLIDTIAVLKAPDRRDAGFRLAGEVVENDGSTPVPTGTVIPFSIGLRAADTLVTGAQLPFAAGAFTIATPWPKRTTVYYVGHVGGADVLVPAGACGSIARGISNGVVVLVAPPLDISGDGRRTSRGGDVRLQGSVGISNPTRWGRIVLERGKGSTWRRIASLKMNGRRFAKTLSHRTSGTYRYRVRFIPKTADYAEISREVSFDVRIPPPQRPAPVVVRQTTLAPVVVAPDRNVIPKPPG